MEIITEVHLIVSNLSRKSFLLVRFGSRTEILPKDSSNSYQGFASELLTNGIPPNQIPPDRIPPNRILPDRFVPTDSCRSDSS